MVDQVKDSFRAQQTTLLDHRWRARQGIGHCPRAGCNLGHQGFKGQGNIRHQRIAHRRTRRLARITGDVQQLRARWQVVTGGELVITKHRRAYYQNHIMVRQQAADPGNRRGKHTAKTRMTRRERAARCRRGHPDGHAQFFRQLHGQRVAATAIYVRAEHQHRVACARQALPPVVQLRRRRHTGTCHVAPGQVLNPGRSFAGPIVIRDGHIHRATGRQAGHVNGLA